jgi:hypothetical protein
VSAAQNESWPVYPGWYDYENEASTVVETLHHEWTFNPHLCQRVVASGVWEYLVDLSRMTQTNIKHPANKQRHIRRWTAALGADQTPPGELANLKEEKEEEENSTATPPTAAAQSGAPLDCTCLKQFVDVRLNVVLHSLRPRNSCCRERKREQE